MQTDKKPSANKVAMSRALGTAFLSHQVEQLEKSLGKDARGPATGSWRAVRGGKRGGGPPAHAPHPHGGRKKDRKDGDGAEARGPERTREEVEPNIKKPEKDVDVIVVDASVLVHALGQVKKWCKDGKEEIVIPLEALNTLDLLKKGATPLAQRARAASRTLEAQVGSNPRIRVQRDDAFVLWDDVPFSNNPMNGSISLAPPPEWLRRTICCGSWEVSSSSVGPKPSIPPPSLLSERSVSPLSQPLTPNSSHSIPLPSEETQDAPEQVAPESSGKQKKVVIAVLAHPVPAPSGGTSSSLDANTFHPGRYERADGSLVRVWAKRAGIDVLDVDPSTAPFATPIQRHPSSERRRSYLGPDKREFREGKDTFSERDRERKPSLVEKPIAMTIVNDQPVKPLRLLARGEKLDP